MKEKYTEQETQILNQISDYCQSECCSCDNCPEDDCVLFRIEKIIENTTKEGD